MPKCKCCGKPVMSGLTLHHECFAKLIAQNDAPTQEPAKSGSATIRFKLDGCDISFVAKAPADMTLEQLLNQADRIRPWYCACGIRHLDESEENDETEIVFEHDSVRKMDEFAPCDII